MRPGVPFFSFLRLATWCVARAAQASPAREGSSEAFRRGPRHGKRRWSSAVPLLLLLGCMSARYGAAQSPSSQVTGPTMAVGVPLSGRQSQGGGGSVSVMQGTTNSGGGNTVNSINSTVSVQMPYTGSTPMGKSTGQVISLTLARALELGLKYNLGAVTEANTVAQAKGQRDVAKSTLLPNLNTGISEVFERENLRTLGVSISLIPESVQFNYYDARALRLQQSVFDLVRVDNLHSASENLKASIQQVRNARDLIVLAVGGSYLQLIATNARVQAAQAQVESSRAVAKQAQDRFEAGVAPRVDSQRARVQYQTEEQRLRSLQADRDTAKLQLGRLIGLPLGQPFDLADVFRYTPLTDLTQDAALAQAFQQRSDLRASVSAVRAAELAEKAAHAERLPNLAVSADFGAAGTTPDSHSTAVYTVSGTLTIPIYEGGRIHGDIEQADAALRQRKSELEDTHGQVDEDVRQAFINLNSAADQVTVAENNQSLAHETLRQSQDRFAAGVADSVEVVQSEQAVVQADDDYITAVYEHNLAKVSLARAMGNAEQNLPQLLRK